MSISRANRRRPLRDKSIAQARKELDRSFVLNSDASKLATNGCNYSHLILAIILKKKRTRKKEIKTLTAGGAVLADVSPRQVPHNHGCKKEKKY